MVFGASVSPSKDVDRRPEGFSAQLEEEGHFLELSEALCPPPRTRHPSAFLARPVASKKTKPSPPRAVGGTYGVKPVYVASDEFSEFVTIQDRVIHNRPGEEKGYWEDILG